MTQGERVREVRKNLGLTLEKFGERIGLKKSSMSAIETGRNILTDANIKAICREFGINRTWLTSGEGGVFVDSDDDFLEKIDRIMAGENETRKNMMKALVNASDDDIEVLSRLIFNAYNSPNEDVKNHGTYKNNQTTIVTSPKPAVTLDPRDADALSAAVREAEESYIKSRSGSARKKASSASNSTDGEGGEVVNQ